MPQDTLHMPTGGPTSSKLTTLLSCPRESPLETGSPKNHSIKPPPTTTRATSQPLVARPVLTDILLPKFGKESTKLDLLGLDSDMRLESQALAIWIFTWSQDTRLCPISWASLDLMCWHQLAELDPIKQPS